MISHMTAAAPLAVARSARFGATFPRPRHPNITATSVCQYRRQNDASYYLANQCHNMCTTSVSSSRIFRTPHHPVYWQRGADSWGVLNTFNSFRTHHQFAPLCQYTGCAKIPLQPL